MINIFEFVMSKIILERIIKTECYSVLVGETIDIINVTIKIIYII